jgi:hypothetical protein
LNTEPYEWIFVSRKAHNKPLDHRGFDMCRKYTLHIPPVSAISAR